MFDDRHLHLRKFAQTHIRDRRDARLVLVAQGNVQQQIRIRAHTRTHQLLRHQRGDFEGFGKSVGGRGGHVVILTQSQSTN